MKHSFDEHDGKVPNPSETKLVETPRTDAALVQANEFAVHHTLNTVWLIGAIEILERHSRQLERELDECQQWRLGPNGVKWYIERTEKAERELASLADELRLAREACAAAYEEAALICETNISDLLLATGEMTPQELRSVRATLNLMARRIRSAALKDAASSGPKD